MEMQMSDSSKTVRHLNFSSMDSISLKLTDPSGIILLMIIFMSSTGNIVGK